MRPDSQDEITRGLALAAFEFIAQWPEVEGAHTGCAAGVEGPPGVFSDFSLLDKGPSTESPVTSGNVNTGEAFICLVHSSFTFLLFMGAETRCPRRDEASPLG